MLARKQISERRTGDNICFNEGVTWDLADDKVKNVVLSSQMCMRRAWNNIYTTVQKRLIVGWLVDTECVQGYVAFPADY